MGRHEVHRGRLARDSGPLFRLGHARPYPDISRSETSEASFLGGGAAYRVDSLGSKHARLSLQISPSGSLGNEVRTPSVARQCGPPHFPPCANSAAYPAHQHLFQKRERQRTYCKRNVKSSRETPMSRPSASSTYPRTKRTCPGSSASAAYSERKERHL
jgi:hypothetical protein